MDIVGDSKLASDAQPRVVQQLRTAIRGADHFQRARNAGSLVCIPTGDGMARAFLGTDVAAPLRTALEIDRALASDRFSHLPRRKNADFAQFAFELVRTRVAASKAGSGKTTSKKKSR